MMTETLLHLKQPPKAQRSYSTTLPKTNGGLAQFQTRQENVRRSGSFVVGQKLRESKWFTHAEIKIFCAVVESGFVVEQKEGEATRCGVAVWAQGYEKSKDPEHITVHTVGECRGKFKVLACKLDEFWPEGTQVRINNKSDKTETPLGEEVIRNQISAAEGSKRKWHNTEHFAFYCRYGPVANNFRVRKLTDQLRWNTGTFFLKIRSLTAK